MSGGRDDASVVGYAWATWSEISLSGLSGTSSDKGSVGDIWRDNTLSERPGSDRAWVRDYINNKRVLDGYSRSIRSASILSWRLLPGLRSRWFLDDFMVYPVVFIALL
jgi:hypothetical protein